MNIKSIVEDINATDAAIKAAQTLKHPTYGSLADLVTDIEKTLQESYWPLIAQIGALRWFANNAQPSAISDGRIEEAVQRGMHLAWQLGQTYWQQAASESWKQNAMAKETIRKFGNLLSETRSLLFERPVSAISDERDYKKLYLDLIMQVGKVYLGESRHDTAKRYIVRAEDQPAQAGQAAAQEGK